MNSKFSEEYICYINAKFKSLGIYPGDSYMLSNSKIFKFTGDAVYSESRTKLSASTITLHLEGSGLSNYVPY